MQNLAVTAAKYICLRRKAGKRMTTKNVKAPSLRERTSWRKAFQRDWHLYLMLVVPIVLVVLYNYAAYPGLRMVFMDYKPAKGYAGSKWVGWETFQKVFRDKDFLRALKNSLVFTLRRFLLMFSSDLFALNIISPPIPLLSDR